MASKAQSVNEQVQATLERLQSRLLRSDGDPRPVVLMTSGVSGAGKSTLSKAIVAKYSNFIRLSIDAIVAEKHGIYGRDYSPEKYAGYLDEADVILQQRLRSTLQEGKDDIVLDRSFYAKVDRDAARALVERSGGRCVLVYFDVPEEVLWRRIVQRREEGINADSARVISEELLAEFIRGFEVPHGEGEIVVQSSD